MNSMSSQAITVYAFYHFTPINEPRNLVKQWQEALSNLGMHGRIYINQQGINAQCSLPVHQHEAFESWIRSDERFKDVQLKLHHWHEHVFEYLHVRYRQHLVAVDEEVDPSQGAKHIPPEEWAKILEENDENTIVLDVRNQYEYELGHFEGAIAPQCKTFKDYIPVIDKLKKSHDPEKTRILMSCTGGIRCEVFSPLMKKAGFKNIYQLDGGVINYGLKVGTKHWKGQLFVFDDRMTVDIADEPAPPIAECHHCKNKCSDVYNCANMDCNKMFFACNHCIEDVKGCCCQECISAPRTRPVDQQNPHKPFRRWYHYRKRKEASAAL